MIEKDKIVFKEKKYFTPSWSGATGVKVLKALSNNRLLVKCNKTDPFIRNIKDVYYTSEGARRGIRDWEHDEKKRRKKK